MSSGGSYDPRSVESGIYEFWEQGGYFHAEPDPNRKPYVIDIPLPNVTGSLHLGHALNNTIQDVLIRYHRMRGFNAMWMPGTDHAGIATQAVVEKRIFEEEGKTRQDIGRPKFERRIWAWKEEYGGQILQQLRRMGCSCDWQRTRFTLDEVCAKAVYEVFFRWFKDGLIYRGLRLVNWDAALQTAVADDEIIHETVQGHLWHYRYPIMGSVGVPPAEGDVKEALARATRPDAKLGQDYLVIATTRPETMLGDTAVAVHPDDQRYKHLIGKNCLLPLMNRPIPIIADDILVDPEFGTGCVKVTPGHDPNDYEFAQRHNVEMINILTPDGRINENGRSREGEPPGELGSAGASPSGAFDYVGLDRYEARQKVVADLEALGLMEKVEPYETEIGHSDRSKTPIEPMLSKQWFMRMGQLADMTMDAVRDGRVRFFPERYAKTYLDWLGEKRDWCISRQLWWGHRIPVWTTPILPLGQKPQHFDSRAWIRIRLKGLGPEQEEAIDTQVEPAPDEGVLLCHVCVKPGHPEIEAKLRADAFEQDPDVLDTWFSSQLWPFSTLGWPDNYGRGWPEQNRDRKGAAGRLAHARGSDRDGGAPTDLEYFYPTSTLVTARGIITLWVARMVMAGLYFVEDVPFSHVYIHPIIQDGQGRTMSKSIGNGVDPLDLIDLYGADALRFTMVQMATETQDVRMPVSYLCPHCGSLIAQDTVVPKGKVPAQVQKVTCKSCKKPFATVWAGDEMKQELGVARDTSDRFELGRNFCNKLWQAATGFVLPNLKGSGSPQSPVVNGGVRGSEWPRPLQPEDLAIEDRWILSRLAGCIEEVDRRFARYQFNELANTLYSFFWGDFCDWYVELVKPRLYDGWRGHPAREGNHGQDARATQSAEDAHAAQSAAVARQVLAWVLDQTLRLLHPVAPFITEALWKKLNEAAPQRGIQTIRSVGPPSPTPDATAISSALIVAMWPDAGAWKREADIETGMRTLQDVIRALRDIRAHVNQIRAAGKEPSIRRLPRAVIRADAHSADRLKDRLAVIKRLGQCEALEIGPDVSKPPESASNILTGASGRLAVYVPLAGLADLDIERKRLGKERDEVAGHLKRLEAKLANENFVAKAPPAVVERERSRLAELKGRLAAIEQNLAEVGG